MTMSTPSVSLDELRRRLQDRSLVLVDVLPRESYAGGHIPGAVNLPVAEISARAAAVLPDRNAEIVVYCSKFT